MMFVPGPSAPWTISGTGIFDSVAEDYLQSAEEMFPSKMQVTKGELADLRALRERRITAARDGIKLEIGDVKVDPKAATDTTELTVTPMSEAGGLPPGRGCKHGC